jgi:hypothetical protein
VEGPLLHGRVPVTGLARLEALLVDRRVFQLDGEEVDIPTTWWFIRLMSRAENQI